jgi:hypothetical protein
MYVYYFLSAVQQCYNQDKLSNVFENRYFVIHICEYHLLIYIYLLLKYY